MRMVVAEQAALPAAETVESHGHGDGHVDSYHPHLHAVRVFAPREQDGWDYFSVGMANSAPAAVDAGQRWVTAFCFV